MTAKPHLKRLSAVEWIVVMPNGWWLPLQGDIREIAAQLAEFKRTGMFGYGR